MRACLCGGADKKIIAEKEGKHTGTLAHTSPVPVGPGLDQGVDPGLPVAEDLLGADHVEHPDRVLHACGSGREAQKLDMSVAHLYIFIYAKSGILRPYSSALFLLSGCSMCFSRCSAKQKKGGGGRQATNPPNPSA